jgi:AbrB family looped-hinge helix DNA binding protein
MWYNLDMDTLHKQNNSEFESTIGPKGQITLPTFIRKKLGLETKDKVVIRIEGDEVKVAHNANHF